MKAKIIIISIDVGKAFDKIQHHLMKKTQQILQHNKGPIYDKPSANIILKGKKLKAFLLRSGKRQDVHFTT